MTGALGGLFRAWAAALRDIFRSVVIAVRWASTDPRPWRVFALFLYLLSMQFWVQTGEPIYLAVGIAHFAIWVY